MKQKNGFTLVELIVVIALMISILVIAIVSFTNISNSKKSESWSYVKQEIETAAEEYLTTNEYLFEGLDDDDEIEGKISLGKLVSLGYLSSVTDPRTGEALSSCTVVNITKTNGVLTASLDETTINDDEDKSCDTTYSLSIKLAESSAPEFELKFYKNSSCTTEASTTNGYYNKSNTTNGILYVKITPTSPSSIQSYNVKLGTTTLTNAVASGKDSYCIALEDDGEYELEVTLTGKNGKSSKENTEYAKDTVVPSCTVSFSGTEGEINGEKTGWYVEKNVTVSLSYSDSTKNNYSSGVVKQEGSIGLTTSNKTDYNGVSKTAQEEDTSTSGQKWYGYVMDEAGNTSSCNNTVKLEKSVTLTFDSSNTNKGSAYYTSGANKGKAKGLVFASATSSSSLTAIKYNSGESGYCRRGSSSSTTGCASNSSTSNVTYYYGRSCKYVGDYYRYFYVKAASDGYSTKSTEKEIFWFDDESSVSGLNHLTSGSYASYTSYVDQSTFKNYYYTNDMKKAAVSSGTVNFTMHSFQYTSTAGNTSDVIVLYTEYSVECGY